MTATTIDEVIENLEQIIQESISEESTLGYFAALYQNVTIHIKEKLGKNYFDDDKRMEQLDVIFANRYLTAYAKYKEKKEVTKSWAIAFKSSTDSMLIVLQHLLLGMNAHINLDLGIAASEVTDDKTIKSLESDFNKINELLATLVDEVQKDLAEIWPTLLKILKFLKKVDDFLINFSMKLARNKAWEFANELVKGDKEKKEKLLELKDLEVSEFSEKIINPGILVKILFTIIRLGERGKSSDKTKKLEKLIENKLDNH
ncbi:DUF5995 family protein [Flavivirga amylovorans]|uniref:DUF5995 family protein n=1 Tax=Flavivirga amylovorans TaxID=870486 RepID=A0ABT8X798_9FLAO|nr:DUF5995 family protein [Flavivirga amylovorans]MDO5989712.1 DUF5995 family protein [Flavivirga amylovorans]